MTMMKKTLSTAVVGLGLLASGCYTTKIYSGTAPATASATHTERWHHTLVLGLAEIADPVDLEGACPQGTWAQVDEEVSFVNGLVSGVTQSIYTPRTYSVRCAGGGMGAPGAFDPASQPMGAPPPATPQR